MCDWAALSTSLVKWSKFSGFSGIWKTVRPISSVKGSHLGFLKLHHGMEMGIIVEILAPMCMRTGLCWLFRKLFNTVLEAHTSSPELSHMTKHRSGFESFVYCAQWKVFKSLTSNRRSTFSVIAQLMTCSPQFWSAVEPQIVCWLLKSPATPPPPGWLTVVSTLGIH